MKAEANKVVAFKYEVYDEDGTVLETTGDEAAAYIFGSEAILPGLEAAMADKEAGHEFEVAVTPETGFGEYDEDLVVRVPKSNINAENLEVGMEFMAELEGEQRIFEVVELEDENAILDGNHPYAGKNLKFKGQVIEVREATKEELEHGHVHHHGESCEH